MQSRMRFSAFVCLRRIPSSSMPICSSRRLSPFAAPALSPLQPARPASTQASPTATYARLLLRPTFCSLSIAPVGSDDHEVAGAEFPFDGVDRHQPLGRQAGLDPDVPGRAVGRLHLHP